MKSFYGYFDLKIQVIYFFYILVNNGTIYQKMFLKLLLVILNI